MFGGKEREEGGGVEHFLTLVHFIINNNFLTINIHVRHHLDTKIFVNSPPAWSRMRQLVETKHNVL